MIGVLFTYVSISHNQFQGQLPYELFMANGGTLLAADNQLEFNFQECLANNSWTPALKVLFLQFSPFAPNLDIFFCASRCYLCVTTR